jgi:hypothetical protein
MEKLQTQLREMCEETCGEVNFYNNYSGRGMYGRNCVGITGALSACMRVIAEVIKQAHYYAQDGEDGSDPTDFNKVVDTLLNYSQDSMGYDVIVYWERLSAIEEEEQEESSSEE